MKYLHKKIPKMAKLFFVFLFGIISFFTLSCSMQQVKIAKQEPPLRTTEETVSSSSVFFRSNLPAFIREH